MNTEKRIGLQDLEKLYQNLSTEDDLPLPDFAIFKRVLKELYENGSKYWGFEYVEGNIPEDHEKIRYHSDRADGEYL
ncbi:hypothetical protein E4H04_11600 [Candidatus Bathyarchaeota archaeon]|jgi:hypothetical protein|nr:MAG: hypothetical protein E4H04_11600 [Candidatus Bathyarchaeota archaeon]